ncbi:CPBP family intramembrane glutamic endopeptidase [Fodinicola acaciae]|uniref:CPBP family intramembrane glutamic endopeptidase n=1 Tax=Fodinicola acaciae TaxID=2681555 RepID=UPI0013D21036|nr:CPBP family intramembrane glutamic endopeptidase [Fodinicola acaciae]
MATAQTSRPNRLADKLLADQHSLPLSIALHLVPGALVVAAYFLVNPLVHAAGCPSFLSWAIALCVILGPVLVGLLWLGRRRNGRYSLRGVLKYLDKPVSRGKLVAIVAALIVWFVVVSLALTVLDNAIYQAFFTWLPFDGAGSATGYLAGYPRSTIIATLAVCLPLTGFALPLIEELYFRGFLLPRLPQLGRWAPLVNTVLFSLYHFWSPWGFVSRVIFFLPGPLLVWWKKDLRLSIGMHPGTTLLLTAGGLVALAFNLAPGLTS